MAIIWSHVFEVYGIKVVSKTDKSKSAYVPNGNQRSVLEAAGIHPSSTDSHPVVSMSVLFDPHVTKISASYYNSIREGAGRAPEARMGRDFIRSWLEAGDEVVIGLVAGELFVAKRAQAVRSTEDVMAHLAMRAAPDTVRALAKLATGKPKRRQITREDFERNPFVVAAARVRANGRCEMPGCRRSLFTKDDGTRYLEVHHVIPLGEEGDDTFANVAALCPHCHREIHFGANRAHLRRVLQGYISSLSP